MDRLRNVMGLLLGTNAHMGHKYLDKHTMHMFTFGHTNTDTQAGTHIHMRAVASEMAV